MRDHILLSTSSNEYTPDEPWTDRRPHAHWYNHSADFARKWLGEGIGECLVIGSPLFEAYELDDAGWKVTYIDIRDPVFYRLSIKYIKHDACHLPFADESFDVISSSCVLCHAGMGRYGDPVTDDGDELVLSEIKRVLKPKGLAAVTFGPVIDQPLMLRLGNMQRVYTLSEAKRMVDEAGLKIERIEVLNSETGVMSEDHEPRKAITVMSDGRYELGAVDYLSMLLRKT